MEELFKKIINNSFIRKEIFSKVNWIHLYKYSKCSFKFDELNIPQLLAYSYYEDIFNLFNKYNNLNNDEKNSNNHINKLNSYKRPTFSDIQIVISGFITIDRIDLIKRFITLVEECYADIGYQHRLHLSVEPLLTVAAQYARLHIIIYLLEELQLDGNLDSAWPDALMKAGTSGDLPTIEYLYNRMPTQYRYAIHEGLARKAIEHDHLPLLLWLEKQMNAKVTSDLLRSYGLSMADLSATGRPLTFETLKFLLNRSDEFKMTVSIIFFSTLVQNNRLDVFTWLVERYPELDISKTLAYGLYINSVKVIELFHSLGLKICLYESAVISESKETMAILDWLTRNPHIYKRNFTDISFGYAAAADKRDAIQWLLTNTKAKCTAKAIVEAAKNNRLEMVHWLLVERKLISDFDSSEAISHSISKKNLPMFRLLMQYHSTTNHPSTLQLFKLSLQNCAIDIALDIAKYHLPPSYINVDLSNNKSLLNEIIMASLLDFSSFKLLLDLSKINDDNQDCQGSYRHIIDSIEKFQFIHGKQQIIKLICENQLTPPVEIMEYLLKNTNIKNYHCKNKNCNGCINEILINSIAERKYNNIAYLLEFHSDDIDVDLIISKTYDEYQTLQSFKNDPETAITMLKLNHFELTCNDN